MLRTSTAPFPSPFLLNSTIVPTADAITPEYIFSAAVCPSHADHAPRMPRQYAPPGDVTIPAASMADSIRCSEEGKRPLATSVVKTTRSGSAVTVLRRENI